MCTLYQYYGGRRPRADEGRGKSRREGDKNGGPRRPRARSLGRRAPLLLIETSAMTRKASSETLLTYA